MGSPPRRHSDAPDSGATARFLPRRKITWTASRNTQKNWTSRHHHLVSYDRFRAGHAIKATVVYLMPNNDASTLYGIYVAAVSVTLLVTALAWLVMRVNR